MTAGIRGRGLAPSSGLSRRPGRDGWRASPVRALSVVDVQAPHVVLSCVNRFSDAAPVAVMDATTAGRFSVASPLPKVDTAVRNSCRADCSAVTGAW